MTASDSDNNETLDDATWHEKLNLKSMQDVKELEQSQLLDYVEKLHTLIIKKCKKLRKCRRNLKDLLTNQTEHANDGNIVETASLAEKPSETEEKSDEISASAAFSFVDEMRQAAEHAQNINNFVYEPTSGLYYDPKTGYYYNAEYGLYYDGNTGCYYSYNQTKNEFEFHSQAQVQDNKTVGADADADAAAADEDDANYEVEFDEYGGVITDKDMLKQIREQKSKKEQQKLEKKKKSKRESKKSKSHKELHKAKKRRKHARHTRSRDANDSRSESENENDENRHSSRRKKAYRKDVEDGELSESSTSSDSSCSSNSDRNTGCSDSENNDDNVPIFKAAGQFQDIAKKYPPSLRIIVQETNIEDLKVGSLHLITFKGGTLGREGAHDVIIPDVNVSKCHLKFNYDTKKAIYKCIDLGSRNGTVLNGTRMCDAKVESKAHALMHGSVLQIGQTKLLCHVHEGNSTCGLCEPGLLIESAQTREQITTSSVALTHKEQLKMLQRKYGLENEKFMESKAKTTNYNDRAATRRIKVGSSTDKEKTEVASVNTAISSENKGFKMLSKLGWSKGDALGKTSASGGLLEPINVVSNEGKVGLGCEQPATSLTFTLADKKKMENLKITQERYKRADIFLDSDDSD